MNIERVTALAQLLSARVEKKREVLANWAALAAAVEAVLKERNVETAPHLFDAKDTSLTDVLAELRKELDIGQKPVPESARSEVGSLNGEPEARQ